jgi:general secretion pathway protein G
MIEKRNEGGFTLIELLIVIIILAILAAIVVFAVGTTGSNAKVAACNSDAKTLETALESYKAVVGVYPGDASLSTGGTVPTQGSTWAGQKAGVYGLLGTGTGTGVWTAPNGSSAGPFLRQLSTSTHYTIWTDGLGQVFVYSPAGNGTGPGGTATPAATTAAMDLQTLNNFDTTPGVCANVSV